MVLARKCGEDAHYTTQSLTVVRRIMGEMDMAAALATGSDGKEREEVKEGGSEGGSDFEKHRYLYIHVSVQ